VTEFVRKTIIFKLPKQRAILYVSFLYFSGKQANYSQAWINVSLPLMSIVPMEPISMLKFEYDSPTGRINAMILLDYFFLVLITLWTVCGIL